MIPGGFSLSGPLLMEGALGTRLRSEYGLTFDPHVAMAALCLTEKGRAALRTLWGEYLGIAHEHGLPFLAATPTRRAGRERMEEGGYGTELFAANTALLKEIRAESGYVMYIGGLMGSRGDAYTGAGAPGRDEARDFHAWQAEALHGAGVDFLYAALMPALPESEGMAAAMGSTGLPCLFSFTLRRDGRLPDGTALSDAICRVDEACARAGCKAPLCYMTNCVHPRLVREALLRPFNRTDAVQRRFRGIQANASPLDMEVLDGADGTVTSPPEEWAQEMAALRDIMDVSIWGGCCGTDGRHLAALAELAQAQDENTHGVGLHKPQA